MILPANHRKLPKCSICAIFANRIHSCPYRQQFTNLPIFDYGKKCTDGLLSKLRVNTQDISNGKKAYRLHYQPRHLCAPDHNTVEALDLSGAVASSDQVHRGINYQMTSFSFSPPQSSMGHYTTGKKNEINKLS